MSANICEVPSNNGQGIVFQLPTMDAEDADGRLNNSDYAYFKLAMDGVANSNSILAFVQGVLVAKYGLKDGDRIELDGRIVRA
jgi:hypothetical protein